MQVSATFPPVRCCNPALSGRQPGVDSSKALRAVIDAADVFGTNAAVQRCQRHKERNVLAQLPEADRLQIRTRLHSAWPLTRQSSTRAGPTPGARCATASRRRLTFSGSGSAAT